MKNKTTKNLVKTKLSKETYLILSIELITGFESWCVQSTLVVLQSLGDKTERLGVGLSNKRPSEVLKWIYLTPIGGQLLQNSLLSGALCVSYQQVLHHFDLLVDMVEDLSAAFCTLLDPRLLRLVLCPKHNKHKSSEKYSFHSTIQTKAINHKCTQKFSRKKKVISG